MVPITRQRRHLLYGEMGSSKYDISKLALQLSDFLRIYLTNFYFVLRNFDIFSNEARENIHLQQADIAALLAGALGVGFPSNSVGRFPQGFWTDRRFVIEALKANFYQVSDLMMTKKVLVESNRNFPVIQFEKEREILESIQSAEKLAQGDDINSAVSYVSLIVIKNDVVPHHQNFF